MLDGERVPGITSALRSRDRDVSSAIPLLANKGIAFQGPMPVGMGFVLTSEEAQELLCLTDADYGQIVRPYLVGEDVLNSPEQAPSRYIIDFGLRPLEEAMRHPAALEVLRERVKPERERNRDHYRREHWWLLGRPVIAMREAVEPLSRYMVNSRVCKRIQFVWCARSWCPSDRLNIFALENDWTMGLLTSSIHTEWAQLQGSTFEDRIHYTPTSAFETFPWPDPITDAQRERIADLARKIVARRQEICLERQIGLTRLYNEVDDGAYADLAQLHRKLDEAVCTAYGWPRSIAGNADETNARLLALNQEIAAGRRPYDPFSHLRSGRPGIRSRPQLDHS
jgi:hypothetical protein